MEPDPINDSAAPSGSHLALYRRWRAQTFSRIIGQDAVVTTLQNAVRTGQVAHALLFVGPRGTGKTSMARIMAKALNCTNLEDGDPCDVCPSCVAIREGRTLDVVELDAATNNRVDDMRELLERTWTAPSDLRRKVYIIDEVQRITQGWDVLLRTLEEPPDHVAFIFCTTDAAQIRPAVLSRVQRFEFRRLTVPEIEGKLSTILAADGRVADPAAVALVARQAAGGMRDAESILDQLLASAAGPLTVDGVRDLLGLVDADVIAAFLAALVSGDALAGIDILDDLEAAGRDIGAFLEQIVVALRGALSGALAGSPSQDPSWTVSALTDAARRIVGIDPIRPGSGGIRFQLELALIGSATPTTSPAPAPRPSPAPSTTAMPSTPAIVEIVPDRDRSPSAATRPGPAPAASGARGGRAGQPSDPDPTGLVAPNPPEAPTGETGPNAEDDDDVEPAAAARHADLAPDPAASPDAGPVDAAPTSAVDPVAIPAAPASDELRTLVRLWPGIVAELSKAPAIKALVKDCRPIAVDGSAVTLGFPEGKAFLKDVAERRRPTLEAEIARALGHPVAVRLVATNLDLLPPLSSTDEDAERIVEAARRIFADDLVDAGEVG